MDKPYDYEALMALITDEIKQQTGIDCYEANSIGPQQSYPFFTFDIVDPHIKLPFTDNIDFEQFEMTIQFDAHSQNIYEATNLASQLSKMFGIQSVGLLAEQNGFYIIETEDVQNTDNVISIQVERRSGFVVRLRICDSFQDDIQTIDDVNLNGSDLSDKTNYNKE